MNQPEPPKPPAGWYPDPSGGPGQRYFDGTDWTDHRVSPPTPGSPQPKSSKPNDWKHPPKWLIATVIAFVALIIIGQTLGKDNGSGTSPTSTPHKAAPPASSSAEGQPPSSPSAPTSTVAPPPETAYAKHDGSCDGDITPKKDGICRVSDGGFFSTGLMAGWIESAGPRDPDHYPNCMWERLSGPDAGNIDMIIASDLANGSTGKTTVHIEKTDYAFWSKGCQPWERLTDR